MYVFRRFRCIGIAPIAASWESSTVDPILCPQCAREGAIEACRRTGLVGGWGFPGIIVVAWYSIANVLQLLRNRAATFGTVLRCLAWGVLLPWTMLIGFLAALILVLALFLNLVESLS
jgi:hypothetical protein